jgi:hypothetical protein
MRYVSKAEKERQRWMTLVEAIKYIENEQKCDQCEAVNDLFRKIADNRVKTRLGNWSSDPDSLGDFTKASRYEFQGEIKVCLDAHGYVMLDSRAAKTKYPIGHNSSYAKVEIVDGLVVDIDFDIEKDVPIPDVNTSDYRPLLVSRDDIQKWPFVSDEEPNQALSAPTQIPEIPDKTLSHTNTPVSPSASTSSEGLITNKRTSRHRRDVTKEAIMALWGPDGLPGGLMDPQRDKAINDWLNKKGRQPVSARTIRRAFAELTVAAIDRT